MRSPFFFIEESRHLASGGVIKCDCIGLICYFALVKWNRQEVYNYRQLLRSPHLGLLGLNGHLRAVNRSLDMFFAQRIDYHAHELQLTPSLAR